MKSRATRRLSRRSMLALAPSLAMARVDLAAWSGDAASTPPASTSSQSAGQPSAPRPFRVAIPRSTVDRIVARVKQARWPDRLEAPDWRYGANWDYMKALADYWVTQYDWRKAEAGLNRYPQFLSKVEN